MSENNNQGGMTTTDSVDKDLQNPENEAGRDNLINEGQEPDNDSARTPEEIAGEEATASDAPSDLAAESQAAEDAAADDSEDDSDEDDSDDDSE